RLFVVAAGEVAEDNIVVCGQGIPAEVLEDGGDPSLPGRGVECTQVDVVDRQAPLGGIVEAAKQLQQCRLAAAVLPHDGERPLRRQPEVELAQHGVAGPRIGEGDSLEADTGLGRRWRPGPGKPQLGTLCGCGQPQDVRYGSYAE